MSSHNEIPSHLPRGKACVPCRRRKMKCDGNQPTCNQCIRFNRADECEFSEAPAPSTTRLLEQHVARLQSRIQELEQDDPGRIHLHNPYAQSNAPTPTGQAQNWWELLDPPSRVTQTLFQNFLPQAQKFGFFLEANRFFATFSGATPPPYVLRSTIYLWGIRLSRDAQLTVYESVFLTRALRSVHDALSVAQDQRQSVNTLYVLQAEVLLAYYFFACNRLLEGKLHAGAAVSLAYMCGLHKMPGAGVQRSSVSRLLAANIGGVQRVLPPPVDAVAEGQRIHAWWTAFILDKSWVVALGSPSMVSEQEEAAVVDTPWPLRMEAYIQQPASARLNQGRTVQRFLQDVLSDSAENSLLAFESKAATLYERANYLATYADRNMPGLETALSNMDASIQQFTQSLPPMPASLSPENAHDLLLIFGLTYGATIQLHRGFVARSPASMAKCLSAAHGIVRVAQAPAVARLGIVNPVVGVISAAAGEVLMHGLRFLRSSRAQWAANPALPSEDQLVGALKQLLGVLGTFASTPFIESQLANMNQALAAL